MDIRQLELFLAVMDSSSVTRAAERVHLSPGAVSLQLRNLADELHTELFARSGKRLIPTPAALRLAEHASTVIKQVRRIEQEFENDPSTDTRPFHFATGVTTLVYRLGRPLRLLRKRYPKTEIRVTVGVTEEITAGLIDRRFDLGLITLPVSEEHLNILPLFEEELLLLRPSPTPVRGGHVGSMRASELAGVPFLPHERCNADWIRKKQVGVVVRSFRHVAAAVAELLQPYNLRRFRERGAALSNRAVFEIPDMLAQILEQAEHASSVSASCGTARATTRGVLSI